MQSAAINLTQGKWEELIESIGEPDCLYVPYPYFHSLSRRVRFNGEAFSRGWDKQGCYIESARGVIVRPLNGEVRVLGSEDLERALDTLEEERIPF